MNLNQSLDHLADAGAEAVEPYSELWWASLTAEELHGYVARGFAAGDVFYAAVAETNRREWEIEERARAAAAAEAEEREIQQRKKSMRALMTAGGIFAVAVIAVALIV